jgi:hypothetical protein
MCAGGYGLRMKYCAGQKENGKYTATHFEIFARGFDGIK